MHVGTAQAYRLNATTTDLHDRSSQTKHGPSAASTIQIDCQNPREALGLSNSVTLRPRAKNDCYDGPPSSFFNICMIPPCPFFFSFSFSSPLLSPSICLPLSPAVLFTPSILHISATLHSIDLRTLATLRWLISTTNKRRRNRPHPRTQTRMIRARISKRHLLLLLRRPTLHVGNPVIVIRNTLRPFPALRGSPTYSDRVLEHHCHCHCQ